MVVDAVRVPLPDRVIVTLDVWVFVTEVVVDLDAVPEPVIDRVAV